MDGVDFGGHRGRRAWLLGHGHQPQPPGGPLSLVKLSSRPEKSPRTLNVEPCPTRKRAAVLPGDSQARWVVCEGVLSPRPGPGIQPRLFPPDCADGLLTPGHGCLCQQHACPDPCLLTWNTGCKLCPEGLSDSVSSFGLWA